MSVAEGFQADSYPRRQAPRFAELLAREGASFRVAIVGKRREGKTDLLRQIFVELFQKAEGPVPFLYRFEAGREGDALVRHFTASLCQQTRAFLMRQEDFLDEPLAELERELERPGLPLALAELGRNLLDVPLGDRPAFAAGLPAQFSHREGRPVCALLDNGETLGEKSPFIAALDTASLCWILAGRAPFVKRVAGIYGWSLARLEPFATEEALAMAERKCKRSGLRFHSQVWEEWFEVAGTSPGWVQALVDAAVVEGQELDTTDALGRVYVGELAEGALCNWLSARWERALAGRRDRLEIARQLQGFVKGKLPAGAASFPASVWEGLLAEEWVTETALAPLPHLNLVERDWLELVASPGSPASEQKRARALQGFLMRAERRRQRRVELGFLAAVRESLALRTQTFIPAGWDSSGRFVLPALCSYASEEAGIADLFWCYGFRGPRRDLPEAATLLLIALCQQEPSPAQVLEWQRRLESEQAAAARSRESFGVARPGAQGQHEFWVVVPPDASLTPVASERRLPWDEFVQLLSQEDATPPSSRERSEEG